MVGQEFIFLQIYNIIFDTKVHTAYNSRSMEFKGDGIDPARHTIALYMLCRRGTPFEIEFLHGRLLIFLMWFLLYHIK